MDEKKLSTSDILALDRTRMAAERTLMGWTRTSLSLITFGFTIYKFLQYIHEKDPEHVLRPNAPRNLGLTLIGIGTFSVLIACVQHWQYVKKLRTDQPYKPWDISLITAYLIGFLGLLMFVSIILKAGPLG